ncbi:MAG: hypothetical protein ACRCSB_00155 [Bacteroidales bacterium]
MILCVDSGASKADWCLIGSDNSRQRFTNKGINPLHINQVELVNTLAHCVPDKIKESSIQRLFFYGAGCNISVFNDLIRKELKKTFPEANIDILPDFLGAARALFANQQGIVTILGTGSVSGVYNGENITVSSNALGYILGDEGSASDLGRQLLQAYFYRQLPTEIVRNLKQRGITKEKVLFNVYQKAHPAIYLSSFLSVYIEFRKHPFIRQLVMQSFERFFKYHVDELYKKTLLPIGVVGSVGYLFSEEISQIAKQRGIEQVNILQYPIEKLADYHTFFSKHLFS